MTEMYTEPDIDGGEPEPEPPTTRASRAHIMFFASMALLALIVTITAVTIHADNPPEQRCDHIDVNIGLNWDHCGEPPCDAEDDRAGVTPGCCRVFDRRVHPDCCDMVRRSDPRFGLYDAEAQFSEGLVRFCARSG